MKDSKLTEILGIPKGTMLTSNCTSAVPALTKDRRYELVRIIPIYLTKGNVFLGHTKDQSAGPLSYFDVTIKEDNNKKELSTPACHFKETSDIIFRVK